MTDNTTIRAIISEGYSLSERIKTESQKDYLTKQSESDEKKYQAADLIYRQLPQAVVDIAIMVEIFDDLKRYKLELESDGHELSRLIVRGHIFKRETDTQIFVDKILIMPRLSVIEIYPDEIVSQIFVRPRDYGDWSDANLSHYEALRDDDGYSSDVYILELPAVYNKDAKRVYPANTQLELKDVDFSYLIYRMAQTDADLRHELSLRSQLSDAIERRLFQSRD